MLRGSANRRGKKPLGGDNNTFAPNHCDAWPLFQFIAYFCYVLINSWLKRCDRIPIIILFTIKTLLWFSATLGHRIGILTTQLLMLNVGFRWFCFIQKRHLYLYWLICIFLREYGLPHAMNLVRFKPRCNPIPEWWLTRSLGKKQIKSNTHHVVKIIKVNIKYCTYKQNTIIPHPRLHKKQALIENFTHTLSSLFVY